MRSRVLVALASLLLLLTTSTSMAQDAAPEPAEAGSELFVVEGVAHNDLLNVRATASPSGKVVGRLPNGAVLRNQGCGDFNGVRWCKVMSAEDANLSGWVAGRYLSEAFEDAAAMPPGEGGGEAPVDAGLAASFDSTGEIPCARYYGQPMTRCSAVSTRGSDGEATITVSWPDGGTRVIFFRNGRADESDSADPLTYTREADLNMIRIGKSERFEIPDTLPFGG